MVKPLPFEEPVIKLKEKIEELKNITDDAHVDMADEIRSLEERLQKLEADVYGNMAAWDRVQVARHPERPTTLDYIGYLFEDFIELHGDRAYGDDAAIVGGIASFGGTPVTVIGHQRGKDTKENIRRNFGMPHPEGYRKALRLMKQAEKFGRPIICFIDTKGAYPGKAAEERGQSEAIARNLVEMAGLRVPVISIVIGEGGSGGALGLGVANHIHMLENSTYSVISPEGAASILWKDAALAQQAAEAQGQPLSNIVFMGMGEPLLNYEQVLRAIERITAQDGLAMSPYRITVSTAGIPEKIRQLADDGVRFNLALSLHAAKETTRTFLMPVNKAYPLSEIAGSLKYFVEKTGTRPTFEYLLLKDINDSLEDAKALALYCRQFPIKINIIEYNNVEGSGFHHSPDKNRDAFIRFLEGCNMVVNVRRSKGKDIDAACGQLAGKQESNL